MAQRFSGQKKMLRIFPMGSRNALEKEILAQPDLFYLKNNGR